MKIKELIKELEKFDNNKEVKFKCDIESGVGSFSFCNEGELGLEEEEGKVVLSVSGEEDGWE